MRGLIFCVKRIYWVAAIHTTLEVYFIYRVQKYIWNIAQFQQDKTNKSLYNLWSNGLVVRVQAYQTKDPRFKTIRRLKNYLNFHPSKVNLWLSRIPGDLVVKVSPHSDSVAYRQMNYIHKLVHQDKWTLKMGHYFFVQYTSEVQLKYS